MRDFRVLKLRAGDIELEMLHVVSTEAADTGPSFKDITGIDPLGTPRERSIAAKLAEAARAVTDKDLDDEDRYSD